MITSGSVNVYDVQFTFNNDWNNLDRIACFRAGGVMIQIPLDETGTTTVPWEVMVEPNVILYVGVYGRNCETGDVVLPTIWVMTVTIQVGVVTTLGGLYMPCEAIIDIKRRLDELSNRLTAYTNDYIQNELPSKIFSYISNYFGDMTLWIRNRINVYFGYLTVQQARELIAWYLPDWEGINKMLDDVFGPSLSTTMEEVNQLIADNLNVEQMTKDRIKELDYMTRAQVAAILAMEMIESEEDVDALISLVVGPSQSLTREQVDELVTVLDDHVREETEAKLLAGNYLSRTEVNAEIDDMLGGETATLDEIKAMISAAVGGS